LDLSISKSRTGTYTAPRSSRIGVRVSDGSASRLTRESVTATIVALATPVTTSNG
jgi:hypothetical protein